MYPWSWWVGFSFHALLFSLLLGAAVCDLDNREIPLGITLCGTLIGLIGSVLMPWPWPYTPEQAMLNPLLLGGIKEGIYAWPVWGPLPAWLAPGGNWQTGLATGLAGALAGMFMLRGVRFLFSIGLGKEAMGLGDADIMMMAGAFLGWQHVVVAFFMSALPALFFAAFQVLFRNDNSLPFGPSLAVGVMATCLGWHWIGPFVQPLFFWGALLAVLVGTGAVILFLSSLLMRWMR